MKKQPMQAAGLLATGVLVGGVLAGTFSAQAADEERDTTRSSTTAKAPGDHRSVHRAGTGGPRGFDGAGLANALGVSEEKLQGALAAVRADLRPARGERPAGPRSAPDRDAHRAKLAAALAEELGMSEDKVTAALEKVREDHAAGHRDALHDRLDDAIKDGKLTSGDKTAILKAFDAGVLGGPGPR